MFIGFLLYARQCVIFRVWNKDWIEKNTEWRPCSQGDESTWEEKMFTQKTMAKNNIMEII